jgi:hypothetical protein
VGSVGSVSRRRVIIATAVWRVPRSEAPPGSHAIKLEIAPLGISRVAMSGITRAWGEVLHRAKGGRLPH